MTAVVLAPSRPARVDRRAVRELAQMEARRHLTGLPLWVGLLGIAYTGWTSSGIDWQAGIYSELPLYFVPLAAATFVAGVRSGGRDRRPDLPPLAEDAPLGDADRAIGRLLGMAPFLIATALAVAAIEVGIRLEGGLWVGEDPGRTDTAVHTIPELVQPIALIAAAAAAGVAAGRAFRRRSPITVLGMIVWFMTFAGWWMFQFIPMAYVTLVQTAPILEYAGPARTDPNTFPADWLLDRPDQYSDAWMRVVVDQWLIGGHVVYLLGLAALGTAAAIRGRSGRRWWWAGLATVVVGLIVQLAATGFVLAPGGIGPGQVPG